MNVDFDTVSQCIGDKTVAMRAVLHLGQVLCADGKAGVKPHHRVEGRSAPRTSALWRSCQDVLRRNRDSLRQASLLLPPAPKTSSCDNLTAPRRGLVRGWYLRDRRPNQGPRPPEDQSGCYIEPCVRSNTHRCAIRDPRGANATLSQDVTFRCSF